MANMATVKFEKIKDKISDFQAFVREKKNIEGKTDGDSVEFTEIKTEELKMFIKKYLHKQSLDKDCRVIIKSGILTVVERKFYEAEG